MLKKNPRRDSNEKVVSTWKQSVMENKVEIEKQRKKQNMALVSHRLLNHFFFFLLHSNLLLHRHSHKTIPRTPGYSKPTFDDQTISKVFF